MLQQCLAVKKKIADGELGLDEFGDTVYTGLKEVSVHSSMLANISFKDSNVQFALNTLIQGYLKHIYSNDCILNNKTATIMKKKKIQCTTVHQVNCIIYYANVHFSIHPYIQYVRSALLLFTFCHTLSHCTCTIRSFIQ